MAPLMSAQTGDTGLASALEHDLAAIPSGSQPTAALIDALSADLGQLFQNIPLPPTVTLDYSAGLLADAAAQGQFAEKDLHRVASDVAQILQAVSFFDATNAARLAELAKLEAVLTRAGVAQSTVQPLATALAALPSAFVVDSYLNYVQVSLQKVGTTSKGYRHASAGTTLNTQLDDSDHQTRDLGVSVYRVPYGKYHVSVMTASGSGPLEIGAFRVTTQDVVPLYDLSPIDVTSAIGSFGDATPKKPLPAGLSFTDLIGIAVTDDQGVQQFTGSFANPSFTTRERRLHLLAAPAAPTAGGTLVATSYRNTQFPSQSFEFVAVGLPVNATLTLSINGAAVQPVTTGPTGDLYIRTKGAEFIGNPPSKDPVSVLSETVDLFTAQSFAVSDAGGNVLLSASAAQ